LFVLRVVARLDAAQAHGVASFSNSRTGA